MPVLVVKSVRTVDVETCCMKEAVTRCLRNLEARCLSMTDIEARRMKVVP